MARFGHPANILGILCVFGQNNDVSILSTVLERPVIVYTTQQYYTYD